MVNYENSKIYKIESVVGDKIYIGSTTKQYLSQRMDTHRSKYRHWQSGKLLYKTTSFILFEEYGLENCSIVLLETVKCETKDELTRREAYYIRLLECVNKVIPHRTKQEYQQENNEQCKKSNKKYWANNKEKIREKTNKYYQENKERLKEKNICGCGGLHTKKLINRHQKTQKHINYVESLKNIT